MLGLCLRVPNSPTFPELHRLISPLTDLVEFLQTKPSCTTKGTSLITGTELGLAACASLNAIIIRLR